jgi:tetratricopeptide repeat protein 21B
MMIGDWEQAIEVAQNIVLEDGNSILAHQILIFNQLARVGSREESVEQTKAFIKKVESVEPSNTALHLFVAKLIARVCSEDGQIIALTQGLLFDCRKSDPLNADFPSEIANQYLMLKDYNKAFQYYQESASLGSKLIKTKRRWSPWAA